MYKNKKKQTVKISVILLISIFFNFLQTNFNEYLFSHIKIQFSKAKLILVDYVLDYR